MEFSSVSVFWTQCFHPRGLGPTPGLGTKNLQAAQLGKQGKNKIKKGWDENKQTKPEGNSKEKNKQTAMIKNKQTIPQTNSKNKSKRAPKKQMHIQNKKQK